MPEPAPVTSAVSRWGRGRRFFDSSLTVMAATLKFHIDVKVKCRTRAGSDMRIGELARATGVSPRSLRYYEEQGLLPSERLPNGYRSTGRRRSGRSPSSRTSSARACPPGSSGRSFPAPDRSGPRGTAAPSSPASVRCATNWAQQERQLAGGREILERYLSGRPPPPPASRPPSPSPAP
ncbi:MerR family DNA-binding transcriptional regulator [Streptomyces sp. PG2]